MPLLQPSWRGRAICDQSRAGTAGHSPILGPRTTDDPLPMFTNLPEEVAWHQWDGLVSGNRMAGQIRHGGMLLSCKSVLASTLSDDANVQSLIQAIQEIARDVKVEIG